MKKTVTKPFLVKSPPRPYETKRRRWINDLKAVIILSCFVLSFLILVLGK